MPEYVIWFYYMSTLAGLLRLLEELYTYEYIFKECGIHGANIKKK